MAATQPVRPIPAELNEKQRTHIIVGKIREKSKRSQFIFDLDYSPVNYWNGSIEWDVIQHHWYAWTFFCLKLIGSSLLY